MELATLKGTEKQVNWAKAIRKDRLKVWERTDPEGFRDAESMLSQQEVSSWWITSRDKSLQDVFSQLAGGAKPSSPKAPSTAATRKAAPCVPMAVVGSARPVEEAWETVTTATGFMRSGPTRDMATGDIVTDSSLPF